MAKRTVAILGGGMGALTAAWALTSLPDARDRFDVHLYQMGWRLGGKGASGRNAAQGQRIEEHGLHVWAGFYDNAFRVMRECFAELDGEEGTFRSIPEAFREDDNIVLGDLSDFGWSPWVVRPPRRPGNPGEGETDLSPWGYLQRLVAFLRDALDGFDLELGPLAERLAAAPPGPRPIDRLQARTDAAPSDARGDPAWERDVADLARQVQAGVQERRAAVEVQVGPLDGLRRSALLLDLAAAALRGMVADRVFERGFDDLDGEEISDWLERHGASAQSLDSGLVLWVYAYVFGYRDGVTSRLERAVAAGTCLRGLLRLLLTYKGAVFYRMRAGMGDTIFTPLYKALLKRGVRFHFFHRVTGLHLDAEGRGVERIAMDRQATIPSGEYRPFVRVKGLDCWPSEPLWDQIEDGAALEAAGVDFESAASAHGVAERLELRRGRNFDEVILGIPVGALPAIAGELIAARPPWKRMIERVRTTATQAVQLWPDAPSPDLGWPHGPSILTAYADELNTWADMSELLETEDWPEDARPESISYFCGQLSERPGEGPAAARVRVAAEARDWMGVHLPFVYPQLPATPEGIARRLVRVGGGTPDQRWAGQFFRANVEGTDRYVQSVPGSTRARLRADRSGFDNLWLAGDWTYTGLNAGCIEAAAMSGVRAAAGLAGVRPQIVGEEADPSDAPSPLPPPPASPPILRTSRPQNSAWPWSAVYGMAETRGASLMLPVPREAVRAMLPPGLGLAPQELTGPDAHPVLLLFARQDDVRMNAMPRLLGAYHEFICVVPWVVHRDAARSGMPPMIWPQRLLLDSVLAIGLGVHGYGYPKERARIDFRQDGYRVADPRTGDTIIAATWSSAGPRARAVEFPRFAQARPAWEMAMVTRRWPLGWQYSVYDFSFETALVEPLEMEVKVGSNGFGLPPGTYRAPSLSESALGGFFLTADGTINNPFQSFDIRRRLREAGR